MSIILGLIGNYCLFLSQLYLWYVITGKSLNILNRKTFLISLLITICTYINHYYTPHLIVGYVSMIFTFLLCKIIFKKTIRETIILTFLDQIVIIFSEAIIMIILSLFINLNHIVITDFYSLLLDVIISIIIFIIARIHILNKFYNWFLKITKNITIYQIIITIMFIALGSNIFASSIYFKNNSELLLILNIVISLVYTIIVIMLFNYQFKYKKFKSKYMLTVEDLYSQEQLISNFRIINHENKNNLMTIKSLTHNKKVANYINTLLKQKNSLNNQELIDMIKLPSCGIRAVMYNKLTIMNDKNIKYYFNIDKQINIKKISLLSDEDIVDLCQVLGVFLDNAIEESLLTDNGEITILFSNHNNKIKISISNLHRQKNSMKSTKGKGRGYGLKLVKRIVDKNDNIENIRTISKTVFTQEIIIKIP